MKQGRCRNRMLRGKLVAYLDHELDARSTAKVAAHLAGCAACRREAKALRAAQALLHPSHRVLETVCIPATLLCRYAESPGTLAPHEIRSVERHLCRCRHCRETVALLRSSNRADATPRDDPPVSWHQFREIVTRHSTRWRCLDGIRCEVIPGREPDAGMQRHQGFKETGQASSLPAAAQRLPG